MTTVAVLERKSGSIAPLLCLFIPLIHCTLLSHVCIIICVSTHYRCTLKTQEFRTKDFVVRSTHSIEHQKCKYCVGWRLAVATQPLIVEHQSASCPEGTRIRQKPTASSEGAQLWDKHHLTLSWSRSAEPAVHTQSACCLRLRGYGETPQPPTITLFFCARQTVSSHPEMGRFWISKDYPYNDEFSAYVDTKEFVRSFYLSLMTEIGLNH